MATRSKPYTKTLMLIDILMLVLTCTLWMFIMIPREMYRFFGPKK